MKLFILCAVIYMAHASSKKKCDILEGYKVKNQWANVFRDGKDRVDFTRKVYARIFYEHPGLVYTGYANVGSRNIYSASFTAFGMRELNSLDLLIGQLGDEPTFNLLMWPVGRYHQLLNITKNNFEYFFASVLTEVALELEKVNEYFDLDSWEACLKTITVRIFGDKSTRRPDAMDDEIIATLDKIHKHHDDDGGGHHHDTSVPSTEENVIVVNSTTEKPTESEVLVTEIAEDLELSSHRGENETTSLEGHDEDDGLRLNEKLNVDGDHDKEDQPDSAEDEGSGEMDSFAIESQIVSPDTSTEHISYGENMVDNEINKHTLKYYADKLLKEHDSKKRIVIKKSNLNSKEEDIRKLIESDQMF